MHTPKLWHQLTHISHTISEASVKMSDVHFNLRGKVKLGSELTASDFKLLEQAHADCDVCAQMKLKVPAAHKGSVVHNTTAGSVYDLSK